MGREEVRGRHIETTEKIVESHYRYVKGWFTISHIKYSGQCEIDLLAIEASSDEGLKQHTKQAGQRRTRSYFRDR